MTPCDDDGNVLQVGQRVSDGVRGPSRAQPGALAQVFADVYREVSKFYTHSSPEQCEQREMLCALVFVAGGAGWKNQTENNQKHI